MQKHGFQDESFIVETVFFDVFLYKKTLHISNNCLVTCKGLWYYCLLYTSITATGQFKGDNAAGTAILHIFLSQCVIFILRKSCIISVSYTHLISPLKNAQKINEIGEELAEIYKVPHLTSDFKKKNGYKRSIELSHEHALYRQNYCGCVFSKKEAMDRERLVTENRVNSNNG